MKFDLDHELAKYLQHLRQKSNVHRSALEEIESHLRDSIDARVESGASEKEALSSAISDFGDARDRFSIMSADQLVGNLSFFRYTRASAVDSSHCSTSGYKWELIHNVIKESFRYQRPIK